MSNPRNKNLLLIIAVLLLINIAVLGYFLWLRKKPAKVVAEKERFSMVDMMQKVIGFDSNQMVQYKQFREKQRETIRPMFDDMRKSKDSLFRMLSNPGISDSAVKNAADIIALKQRAIDLQSFSYFKKVRALCTPEQQPKYDSLVLNMISKMGRPPRHNDDEKKK